MDQRVRHSDKSSADPNLRLLACRAAVKLHPDSPAAWAELAACCEELRLWAETLGAYAKVAALRPGDAKAHWQHGRCLWRMRRPGAALGPLRRAVELRPEHPPAWKALAEALGDLGRYRECAEALAEASRLDPRNPHFGSDALHLLHYDPDVSPEAMLTSAKAWAVRHAEPLTSLSSSSFDNCDRETQRDTKAPRACLEMGVERRLRVGFVSGDFREHPVGRLAAPLLTHLDRSQFELFCYDDAEAPDAVTARLRQIPEITWRRTHDNSYDELSDRIRQDKIDILVDLCGHMGQHRLKLFARRPAPVQATHFNYPATTGMSAMDWRLSDDLAEPAELNTDRYSVERLCRIGPCAWCYDAGLEVPDVGPLPLERHGYVTFTSLNKPLKHTDITAKLWGRVLAAVPGSKLLLLGLADQSENALLAKRYTEVGLPPDRLIFAPHAPRRHYLKLFNEVDIALDPLPYNGGVTSCDALYMGVPLVSLAGQTYHSRQGLMLLTNIQLPELAAKTPEEYVRVAVALARDRQRLAELRATLRDRLTRSPVMNGVDFARRLGDGYRMMWREFCAGRSLTATPT